MGPLRYLRFNFTTADAAGQNLTSKATWAACEWIKSAFPGTLQYILSGGLDTDKKHSHVNMLLTRGRRVVAEAVLQRDLLNRLMGVDTKQLFYSRQIQATGLQGSSATTSAGRRLRKGNSCYRASPERSMCSPAPASTQPAEK